MNYKISNKYRNNDPTLTNKIAVIKEKNVKLENRHREIELDKQCAVNNGSVILPSQIRVTFSPNNHQTTRTSEYIQAPYNGRNPGYYGNQQYFGKLGNKNLSKSMSRLNNETKKYDGKSKEEEASRYYQGQNYNQNHGVTFAKPHHEYKHNSSFSRSSTNNWKHNRGGYVNRENNQFCSNFNQQVSISSAKSMSSLTDPHGVQLRHNNQTPRNYKPNEFHNARGSRQMYTPPYRYNNYQRLCPPPPYHYNPQNKPFQRKNVYREDKRWFNNQDYVNKSLGPWIRGMVITDKTATNDNRKPDNIESCSNCECVKRYRQCRFADDSIDQVTKIITPLNATDSTDSCCDSLSDAYIDDNPLDDLDQFTLKIDMDGGFVVHGASISDPILQKPICSWIDELDDLNSKQKIETMLPFDDSVGRNKLQVSVSLPSGINILGIENELSVFKDAHLQKAFSFDSIFKASIQPPYKSIA